MIKVCVFVICKVIVVGKVIYMEKFIVELFEEVFEFVCFVKEVGVKIGVVYDKLYFFGL